MMRDSHGVIPRDARVRLEVMAWQAMRQGQPAIAARMYGAVEALGEEIGGAPATDRPGVRALPALGQGGTWEGAVRGAVAGGQPDESGWSLHRPPLHPCFLEFLLAQAGSGGDSNLLPAPELRGVGIYRNRCAFQ